MARMDRVVDITITKQTKPVARASFSTLLVLGISKAFSAGIKFYASLDAVLEDFASNAKEALAATDAFAQNPSLTQLAIGRRKTGDTSVVTVATVDNSTEYICTINGTEFSFTSDATATALEIAAGLVAAINAGAEPVTATDNLDGTYDLVADVAGVFYSLKTDYRQTVAFTTSQAIGTDLSDIDGENSKWYGLVYTERTSADVKLAADWVETKKKVFFTASADSNIVDVAAASDTTSIAALFKANAYERSLVMYHTKADSEYIDAAWLGKLLPLDAGSYTAAFKQLASITVDDPTETQIGNARDKYASVYYELGSKNITWEGTSGAGEFIDNQIGIDWFESRLVERNYASIVNVPKLTMDDTGITVLEGNVKAQIAEAQQRKFISDDDPDAIVITVVSAADTPTADKAVRLYQGISFEAPLANAIHKVKMTGNLVL